MSFEENLEYEEEEEEEIGFSSFEDLLDTMFPNYSKEELEEEFDNRVSK